MSQGGQYKNFVQAHRGWRVSVGYKVGGTKS